MSCTFTCRCRAWRLKKANRLNFAFLQVHEVSRSSSRLTGTLQELSAKHQHCEDWLTTIKNGTNAWRKLLPFKCLLKCASVLLLLLRLGCRLTHRLLWNKYAEFTSEDYARKMPPDHAACHAYNEVHKARTAFGFKLADYVEKPSTPQNFCNDILMAQVSGLILLV